MPPAVRHPIPPERIVYRRRGLKKIIKTPGPSSDVCASRKFTRQMARRKLLTMFDKLSGDASGV